MESCGILLIFLLFVSSNTADDSTQLKSRTSLSIAINEFALDFLRSLPEASTGEKNVLFSPVSVSMAMSMLMAGARRESQHELLRALHLDTGFETFTQIHRAFKTLLKTVNDVKQEKPFLLSIANRLLVQSNYSIHENFKWYIADCYHAKILSRDFGANGEEIKQEVNDWISDKTNGMIPTLLSEDIDPYTRLLLLNAVYFEGKWQKAFNEKLTQKASFWNQGLNETEVDMMRVRSKFQITEAMSGDQSFVLIRVPYEGNLSLFLIITESNNGVYKLLPSLTMKQLEDAEVGLQSESMFLNMPRFKLTADYDLRSVLPTLGIRRIFGSHADLSGITNDQTLEVSGANHKASMSLDERGSKVAAASAVRAMSRSLKFTPEFVLNHPFIFYIRDEASRVIHFLGQVNGL